MYIFTKEWIPLLGEKGNTVFTQHWKIYIGAQNGGGKIIKYIYSRYRYNSFTGHYDSLSGYECGGPLLWANN